VNCRTCQSVENRVIRSADRDGMVRRLRRCTQCGHQWATREVPEADVDHTLSIVEKARELAALVSGG
jgi:transcriptional regulator NrdR family protein